MHYVTLKNGGETPQGYHEVKADNGYRFCVHHSCTVGTIKKEIREILRNRRELMMKATLENQTYRIAGRDGVVILERSGKNFRF